MNALRAEPHIVAACVYKKNGKLFAKYVRTPGKAGFNPPESAADSHYFKQDHLWLFQRIRFNGDTEGTILLKSDLRALRSRFLRYAGIVVLVLPGSLFVALLLSGRLQRLISQPILQLVKTAKSIALDRDYSVRAQKQSEDELGLLIDSFNQMLTQIQERDVQLQEAQNRLEHRVLERTAELSRSNSELQEQMEARQQAQEALRKSDERFQLVARATNDCVWDWDIVANTVWWNEGFQKMFGYKAEEIQSGLESWSTRIHPDDLQWVTDSIRRVLDSGKNSWSNEYRFRRADGNYAYIFDRGYIIRNEEGKPIRAVGAMVDITARKQTEEELKKAKNSAEAASNAKSQFLANMSHEIRTPMNGILGMTGLALETNLTAEQRSLLTTVKESGDTLLSIINDILDFSKIEAGKMELEPIAFNLRERLEDTVAALGLRAHEKGLELGCFIDGRVSENLIGDPLRLRQVIVNLLGNAIKFTTSGEVVLRVDCENKNEETTCLRFSVSDTGIGIPEEKQKVIFDAFTQADNSMSRTYGGTGLGLTISKQLIELMGGKIWVESKVGLGSTFHFTAEFVLNREAPGSTRKQPPLLHDVPVLIVDDNATNRFILESYVTRFGMKPFSVSSGHDALEALENAMNRQKPYTLVLLDAMMPELDGFHLARKIHAIPNLPKPAIVMLSSAGQVDAAERCRQLGISIYLTKPVKQSELLDAIMSAMGDDSGWNRRSTAAPAHAGLKADRRLRILLAEDHPVNQRLAVRLLEKWGHHVSVASNGIAAIEAFDSESFDLILMDVQMPEMGGLEATQAIREREAKRRTRIPIVAMTAHAIKGDREQCLAAGMDGYVSKPIEPELLFEAIEKAVGGKSQPAAVVPVQNDEKAFDKHALLNRVGGDHDLLRELVQLFADDTPPLLEELRKAIRKKNAETLERSAHRLKGALNNLSATKAAELASRLEKMGQDKKFKDAAPTLTKLDDALKEVTASLNALITDKAA